MSEYGHFYLKGSSQLTVAIYFFGAIEMDSPAFITHHDSTFQG